MPKLENIAGYENAFQALRGLVEIATDRQRPWRRDFLLYRALTRLPGVPRSAIRRYRQRLDAHLRTDPTATAPLLMHLRGAEGAAPADRLAESFERDPQLSGRGCLSLAEYWYAAGQLVRGDSLLARAKSLDPDLIDIFEVEARDQQIRGNLHAEMQAVEQCLRLARDESERRDWQFKLGDAYLRQQRPEQAWPHFKEFASLPRGDRRAASAAYCARLLGKHDLAARAYAHGFPAKGHRFAAVAAARVQLHSQREDEVVRLLGSYDGRLPTEALELRYSALMRLGRTDEALATLREAFGRKDRSRWVGSVLGSLHEVLDDAQGALGVYEALRSSEHTPLSRFRLAVVTRATESEEAAVRGYLSNADARVSLRAARTVQDLDPAIPRLLQQASAGSPLERLEALRQLRQRAGSRSLMEAVGLQLARRLSETSDWGEAWEAVCFAQAELLPAVSLTTDPDRLFDYEPSMYYAELCETTEIVSDTIVYEAFHGASTSCNPYAICRSLLAAPEFSQFTHVWILGEGATIQADLLDRQNVVFIRKGTPAHARYLATAKWFVNNSTFEPYFTRREGQLYLNTWHGIPWKKLGRDSLSEPFAYGNIARNIMQATHVIAPDAHTIETLTERMDIGALASARLELTGYPRNDLSSEISQGERARLRARLGAQGAQRLVLFMPTWKGLIDKPDAETAATLQQAIDLAGGDYVLAVRAHHFVRRAFTSSVGELPDNIVLVPEEIETNRLLGVADALVTDFSSVLFDAAAAGLPVVKILDSIADYRVSRGLYFEAEEVPGQNADSALAAQELLAEALENPEAFRESYHATVERFGGRADGEATRRTIDFFFKEAESARPVEAARSEPLLLSVGGLKPNGITRSLRSLLVNLDGKIAKPHLYTSPEAFDAATPETIADLRAHATLCLSVGQRAGTRLERQVQQFFTTRRYHSCELYRRVLEAGREREARRLLGGARFASVVDFDGYDSLRTAFVAYGVRTNGRRGIILHNEMWQEITARFPRLRSGMRVIDDLDFAGSVSEGVREANSRQLEANLGVDPAKHVLVENTINVSEIIEHSRDDLPVEDDEWYSSEGVHACVVARLSPEKNHLALLDALDECRSDLEQRVTVTFLGDGPLRLTIEQTVERLGLADLVRVRGMVANPSAHVRRADVMLLPSRHEGQPLVILESLTVQTPVVATDIPGSRSVLHGGELGTLVPLSHEGLIEGLHTIASNRLVPADTFDPERFTARSLGMFLEAAGLAE